MNERDINEFLLCTIAGVSGDFSKNLRAVQVDVKDNELITRFYFDGEITEENKEFASIATTDSTFSFSKGYDSRDYYEHVDYPLEIPNNGRFAYLRYEEPSTQEIKYYFLGNPVKKLLNALNKADVPISEVYWPLLISLLLQEAFLGCIKPNLRSIQGVLDDLEKVLYIWIYFEGEISNNDLHIMNKAIDRVKIYFNEYFPVKSFIDRLDRPQKIPSIGTPIFYGNLWKKSDELGHVEDNEQSVPFVVPPHDLLYFKRNIQEALLRKVGLTLRSIKIEIDEMRKVLYFWFYYDGEISQRDNLNTESIVEYVKGSFSGEFSSNVKIVRLDYPNKIPSIGWPVFERDEKK